MIAASGLHPLVLAFRDPTILAELGDGDWQDLLDLARSNVLSAKLAVLLGDRGLLAKILARARTLLEEDEIRLLYNQNKIRFEVNQLTRALSHVEEPILLLKGSAYLIANLPVAKGRFMTDLDIMVPRDKLDAVEKALLHAGWVQSPTTDYDQRYYREWMHEIPPMWHPHRRVTVDIHHTLVPLTSRYQPDTQALFDAAVPLDNPQLKVLCPADMVLHSAVHLFNEEVLVGLRDLLDLHDLLEYFGKENSFWDDLLARARRHRFERTLFYLLRYCAQIFGTAIPPAVQEAAREGAPNLILCSLMDLLFASALIPPLPRRAQPARALAVWLLFVRAHWLRMPVRLLAPHLCKKALRGRHKGPTNAVT